MNVRRWTRVFVGVSAILPLVAYGESQNHERPYQALIRSRREAAASRQQAYTSAGPVVAKAELRLVPATDTALAAMLGMQRRDATLVRPADLREVPADAPRDPAFFSIRVGDRDVHGVTYRSTRLFSRVKLWLDTDGDGLFSDEREYPGARLSWIQITATYQFGPVMAKQGEIRPGGDVFTIQCSNGQWLMLYPAFYREGRVTLEGRACRIALVDRDFDGRFNGSFVPPAEGSRQPGCDLLGIDLNGDSKFSYGQPGDSEVMPLSRLIRVGGEYFQVDVAEDGSTVEFRRAQPAFGSLDLGGAEVVLGLWSSDAAQQRLEGAGGPWRLPAGRYGAVSLELTRRESGGRWTFDLGKGGAGQLADFEIRPGQTTRFQVGPPFKIHSAMQRLGQDVVVSFELEGQGGERYIPAVKKDGTVAPEPAFKVIDGSGRVVRSGQFKYG